MNRAALAGLQRAADEFEREVERLGGDAASIALLYVDTWEYPYTLLDVARCVVALARRTRSRSGGKARTRPLRERRGKRIQLLRDTYPRQPDRDACRALTAKARLMFDTQAPLLMRPVNATEWLDEIAEALVPKPPS